MQAGGENSHRASEFDLGNQPIRPAENLLSTAIQVYRCANDLEYRFSSCCHAKRLKTLHPEDASSLPTLSQTPSIAIQGVLDIREEDGPSLTFSQASDDEYVARVNEAF